jgi:hypothetical protein
MYTIEEFLNTRDVDWDVHQETGLCVLNSQDCDERLLIDIVDNVRQPIEMLDFGTMTMLCPVAKCNNTIRIMRSLGHELKSNGQKMITGNAKRNFDDVIQEAADELTSGQDVFKQFSKAMKILGEQLGIGPLQQKLKKRGISYRLNKEKDSLVFFINNERGEQQPIARISKQNLSSQHDFQSNLEMMVDMANGDPPGTIKQKQERLREQQGVISDLSRVVFPSDKSSQVASLMLSKD